MVEENKMAKKKTSQVHVLSISSESGDDYGPFLFGKKPSDRELFDFLNEQCPGEMDDASLDEPGEVDEDGNGYGPGWKGSYLHLTWTKAVVR